MVGMPWPKVDEDGPRVAHVFYQHTFKEKDPLKSAESLHKVATAMRKKAGPVQAKKERELLQRWAVHIGA